MRMVLEEAKVERPGADTTDAGRNLLRHRLGRLMFYRDVLGLREEVNFPNRWALFRIRAAEVSPCNRARMTPLLTSHLK
jgi:hypothetical protein